MKKESERKNRLELRRATVRPLNSETLAQVNGAAGPGDKGHTTTLTTITTMTGIPTSG